MQEKKLSVIHNLSDSEWSLLFHCSDVIFGLTLQFYC